MKNGKVLIPLGTAARHGIIVRGIDAEGVKTDVLNVAATYDQAAVDADMATISSLGALVTVINDNVILGTSTNPADPDPTTTIEASYSIYWDGVVGPFMTAFAAVPSMEQLGTLWDGQLYRLLGTPTSMKATRENAGNTSFPRAPVLEMTIETAVNFEVVYVINGVEYAYSRVDITDQNFFDSIDATTSQSGKVSTTTATALTLGGLLLGAAIG